jgi:hypothetical protein
MQRKSAITVETKTFNNHLGFERGLWQHQTRRFVVVPKRRVIGALGYDTFMLNIIGVALGRGARQNTQRDQGQR